MDPKQALAKLKTLEVEGVSVADLVSVVEARIESLEGNNYALKGEKLTATQKSQAVEAALVAIAKAVGLEGDVDSILSEAQSKVAALKAERDTLAADKTTLEARASEAEGRAKSLERKTKLQEVAAKAGANAVALERLMGDQLDSLTIADDGSVKLGDKPLREALEADDGMRPFIPALFPGGEGKERQQQKLPSGSPGGTDKPKDPVKSAISKMKFAVPGGT